MMDTAFEEDLRASLNKHSIDAYCEIPDFILAATLVEFLKAMAQCSLVTNAWNGGEPTPLKKRRKK